MRALCSLLLWLATLPVWAQSQEVQVGSYVLRSSMVPSKSIPRQSSNAEDVARAHNQALINVVVERRDAAGAIHTVPASIEVTRTNLAGIVQPIGLEETRANGYVAYTGTFFFLPNEVLDFKIVARPQGAQRPLTLSYRQQMWQPPAQP